MSLLMGALGGLGQGMVKIGSNLNERLAEDTKALRAENLMRLGIQEKEASEVRMMEEREKFDERTSGARLGRKVEEIKQTGAATEQAKLDFRLGNSAAFEEIARKDASIAQSIKEGNVDALMERISSSGLVDKNTQKLMEVELRTGLPIMSLTMEKYKIDSAAAAARLAKGPKAMSQEDSAKMYMESYKTNLEAIQLENADKGGFFGDKKLSDKEVNKLAQDRTLDSMGKAMALAPHAGELFLAPMKAGRTIQKISEDVSSGKVTKEQALADANNPKTYGLPAQYNEALSSALGIAIQSEPASSKPMPAGGVKQTGTTTSISDPRKPKAGMSGIIDPNLGEDIASVGRGMGKVVSSISAPTDILTKILGSGADKLSTAASKSSALSTVANKRKQGIITYDEYVEAVNAINSK